MQQENPAEILERVLDGVAVVERPDSADARADAGVDAWLRVRGGERVALQLKWAGEGWPQDVRRTAGGTPKRWPSNLVLLARRLSPGAIEWLRERGANWADAAGQARIVGPGGLLVIREPALPPPRRSRSDSMRWSPSAVSIAETLLARPDEPLRAARLARESGWSTAQTAEVLGALDGQAWTAKRGSARGPAAFRELVDAGGLLAAWSGAVADQPHLTRLAHRAGEDAMTVLRTRLGPALSESVGWAASGWAGLELTAPYTTTVPALHVYVAGEDFVGRLSGAIERAGLREVDEGGLVTFWVTDHHVLRLAEDREGLPVVSAPRLYADLSSFGARGQDAADHVRAELIDPLHPEPSARGSDDNAGGAR